MKAKIGNLVQHLNDTETRARTGKKYNYNLVVGVSTQSDGKEVYKLNDCTKVHEDNVTGCEVVPQ